MIRILEISSVSLLLFAGGCCCCVPLGTGSGGGGGVAEVEEGDDTGLQIVGMTLTDGLTENQAPKNEVDHFYADEPAYFSLEMKGRPTGKLKAKFYVHDEVNFEVDSDLDEVNGDVFFSIGEVTYWGLTLAPGENQVMPICEDCRVEIEHNGTPVAQYDFAIKSPEDSIETEINQVTLCETFAANGLPVEPTETFAPSETIGVLLEGSQGAANEVRIQLYANGEHLPEHDHAFIATDNLEDANLRFVFGSFEDWPSGEHELVVLVNRQEVSRKAFTVDPEKMVAKVGDAHILRMTFTHETENNGAAKEPVEVFSPDKTCYFVAKLKGQPKGKMKAIFFFEEEEFANVTLDLSEFDTGDISDPTLSIYATFNLNPGGKLPASKDYRIDLEYNGEPLASYPFEMGPKGETPAEKTDE